MSSMHADSGGQPPLWEKAYIHERQRMVDRQLKPRGIEAPRVLAAMLAVPREEFVPESLRHEAYADGPLPIGAGQTISQPFTVAWMLQALELEGSENVLEIGTGSGYGAAVLSLLAASVHTVERIPRLFHAAASRLQRLGYANVHVHLDDGTLGCPEYAPYDAIVVTAAAAVLPEAYIEQLADGGRIVIPLGEPSGQTLCRYHRIGESLRQIDLGRFVFVPLVGNMPSILPARIADPHAPM